MFSYEKNCKVLRLTNADAYDLWLKLHNIDSKEAQDAFILSYMSISKVVRKQGNDKKPRAFSVKYYAMHTNRRRIRVCKTTFMGFFGKHKLINNTRTKYLFFVYILFCFICGSMYFGRKLKIIPWLI